MDWTVDWTMNWAFLSCLTVTLVGLLLGPELKLGLTIDKGKYLQSNRNWLLSQIVQSVMKLAGDRAFCH